MKDQITHTLVISAAILGAGFLIGTIIKDKPQAVAEEKLVTMLQAELEISNDKIKKLNLENAKLGEESEHLKEEIEKLRERESVNPLRDLVVDIQLGKGFTKELAKAKAENANAVLLKLVSTGRMVSVASGAAFKSDVLGNEKLNDWLERAGVMVVEVDFLKDKRFGGASTARQVWNTGNCVGMVLMDLNGKVLNKLPNDQGHLGPFSKKVVFKISDIIDIYDELVPLDPVGIDLPLVK